jgi:alkaline phosphatase
MMTKNNFFGQIRRTACFCAVFAAMILLGGGAVFAKGASDNGAGRNTATAREGRAKYVFLFIGDGMAMSQISSAEIYATARSSGDIAVTRLGFTGLPVSGLTTPTTLGLPYTM